jgi:hypothetical protein
MSTSPASLVIQCRVKTEKYTACPISTYAPSDTTQERPGVLLLRSAHTSTILRPSALARPSREANTMTCTPMTTASYSGYWYFVRSRTASPPMTRRSRRPRPQAKEAVGADRPSGSDAKPEGQQ